MKVTILGFKKGKTSNGKDFVQYYFSKNFTDYEIENSECAGITCGSEFSYHDYKLHPGDVCDFQYEPGFQGKATLADVIVLKDVINEKLKENEKVKA